MARPLKAPANRKESNVWQNAKTLRWHWEVTLLRRDGTEYRRAGSRKAEKDALASRDAAFADFNSNEGKSNGHTVRTWSEYVMEHIWPNEAASKTQESYRHWLITRVFPILGNVKLESLGVEQLQIFFNRLQEKDVKSAAARTRTALASALTRAVEHGIIPNNPCRMTKLRDARKVKIDDDEEEAAAKRILSMEEVELLIGKAQEANNPMLLPILLGGKMGLRFGECTGLNWQDVDFERNVVSLKRQRQNVRGKGLSIVPLKTNGSKRELPIPASVRPILASERARALSEGITAVCVREDGKPFSPQNGGVSLKTFITKIEGMDGNNGKPIPTHHCLRASLLTYLANHANNGAGVRPSVLMRIAGHTKIQTTMAFYVKASADDLSNAMDAVP